MKRLFWAAVLFTSSAGLANAYCYQPSYYGDFANQVNDSIEYLICLHNKQVNSINETKDAIRGLADIIDSNSKYIANLEDEVSNLRRLLSEQQIAIEYLELRIEDLESK